MDFNPMNELLDDGYWLDSTYGSNFWHPSLSNSSPSNFSSTYLPSSDIYTDNSDSIPSQIKMEEGIIRSNSAEGPPLLYPGQIEVLDHNWETILAATEMSQRLWTEPSSENPCLITSTNKRLEHAFEYLKESTRSGRDVLFQIWVPMTREGKHVLITNNQPFSLNPSCKNLADYRDVSRSYQFVAEEYSNEFEGLPGRVFLKKLPEWTPHVPLLKGEEEHPSSSFCMQYNVSGSLGVPVFEQGSGTCLGVVEIVTTTQKVNCRPELENLYRALEAVDLRSSKCLCPPKVKVSDKSYEAVLAEIQYVMKSVCDSHKFPLAQTWAPCTQNGSRNFDGTYSACVSIIDSASYVPDEQFLGFHEACCKHPLLRGEGVPGEAFLTNKLCFAADIRDFCEDEYPLSHHAKVFELRAAAAIHLRSVYTGSADFVLEFFLPLDCKDSEDQEQMLSLLALAIQEYSRSLRIVTEQELAEESGFPVREMDGPLGGRPDEEGTRKLVSSSRTQDEDLEVTTHWNKGKIELQHESTYLKHEKNRKRRIKSEGDVSLHVLRQHFSGSLKDAAKSIGVCPTTLKSICRKHGITRWPSRKIKKIGDSLRKIQLVIDSVRGIDAAISFGSFDNSFPELSSPNLPIMNSCSKSNPNNHFEQLNTQPSSSSSYGCTSNFCCSTGAKQLSQGALPPLPKCSNRILLNGDAFRVKATFGERKIRFTMLQNWSFKDLQGGVIRRFNIDKVSKIRLKYLDDDCEWILLTSDADLKECIDLHRCSSSHIIRLSVYQTFFEMPQP
ncbi:hypothetical protein LguiB_007389 [Lonicera macranthoides]